jgi:CYTH domain-containing protein
MEIELERTFLLKYKPEGFDQLKSVEILDIYFPKLSAHPTLRLRKKGNKLELTKKFPINGKDSSEQVEHTIILSEEEFVEFSRLEGKMLRKTRYYYSVGNLIAEIDIYHGELRGLCVVDFEFKTKEEKDNFSMPDFCLCDVTQEEMIAGGLLAGKKYGDIEELLNKINYKKI